MKLPVRSIRFRVAAVAATAAVVAMLAAAAVAWSLALAERQIGGALAAQRRLDLWSAVSAHISDYTFTALDVVARGGGGQRIEVARDGTLAAFSAIEQAVTDSITDAPSDTGKAAAANRGRVLARLRAGFEVLDRQIGERLAAPGGEAGDQIRGALNGFAVTFAPNLSAIMDDERRSGTRIQAEMAALRSRMTTLAVIAVAAALVLAAWLYRSVARPLVQRIGAMAGLAAAIGRGDLGSRLAVTGRDELSLAMAGFNRMAARLQRREASIAAERARLEQTIAARTADLSAANTRLAEVDASRRRFFTDVGHELRTPLTVILGECDLMLRRQPAEAAPGTGEALRTIRTRAQRLHRRVEDLLRIARSDTGEIELECAAAPVEAFVAEAIADVATLARRAGVTVETALAPGLAVLVDRDWLRQVVEGLLANAIRHAAGGHIRIGAHRDGDEVELAVADDGSGIDAADLPHVLERFYRGSGGGAGFGIGLALAKWVVERHGGTIAIASRTAAAGGRPGTTVIIRLPAAAVDEGVQA